jgi:hypothetical protein
MGRQTNTARRAQASSVREKAAAVRAETQRRERRRRGTVIIGSSLGVLAVIGVIIFVGVSGSTKHADTSRPLAPATLVSAVTGVPAATLDQIGKGAIATPPTAITDSPLTSGGRPEVLFIGAEFCPYCAAERWPLTQALSRFGSFSGLKTIHSSPTDADPNTATFSYYGASYTSKTLTFVSREDETVTRAPLQAPTAAETALWQHYTNGFPFLDIGGRYVITGPSFDPGILKGLTATAIANQLADPTSKVAQAIDGTANVITAAICKTTANSPAAVCNAPAVTAAAKALAG